MIRYSTDKTERIDWEEAASVVERAPLGRERRDSGHLKEAFEASYAVVYAFGADRLIGMARALCDGRYQAAVYDVVLLPEYQGRGLGREIMRRLLDQLPVRNVILYAAPGREGFYEKFGFRKMRTAMAILNPIMSRSESGYLD
ncbi:MAG: GNAT family N-acetyltransferase [Proteobacteria bacterium]|nr:GNAT family N-acetyltransferase [Pseudomonadota bacterium]